MRRIAKIAACAAALTISGSALAQVAQPTLRLPQTQLQRVQTQGILIDMRPAAQASPEQRAQVQQLQAQRGAGQINIARLQTQNLRNTGVGQVAQFQVTPQSTISARAVSVETAGAVTTWRGEIDGRDNRPPGSATIVMSNAGVMGTIHGNDGRTYRLRPLPGGETAIIELNYDTMPADHPPQASGGGGAAQLRSPALRQAQITPRVTRPGQVQITPGATSETGIMMPPGNQADSGGAMSEAAVSARLSGNANLLRLATRPTNVSLVERYRLYPELWRLLQPPTIDVLVAFTPGAQGFTGDMNLFAAQAIEETNGSFTNSNVWARVRLVGAMSISYNESGRDYDTILSHFTNNGDGFMDNIHAQRDALRADVAVLIINQSDWCGQAREIGANAAQAFVIVHWDCATGYYSFGHEIGHLTGARHDEPTDTTDTPYAHGHGFRHQAAAPNGWRTIMGYRCAGNLCNPRLQYWSSPSNTWSGLAMGTADADNRRVWNDRAATLASFR
jgi:hypothetical protein